MIFTEYFIKHRVAPIILNVMIVVIGLLAFRNISVREYPNVQIATLAVYTMYPNANQALVESLVTNPLEDALRGVKGAKTIVSESTDGSSYITIYFNEGINLDNALIDVKDAVGEAKSELPENVKEPKIQRGSFGGSFPFFCISITSSEMDYAELTHYVNMNLKNNFRSIGGVGKLDVWGRPYTMQITLDPHKMYNYGIDVGDIVRSIGDYNISMPVGKFRDAIPTTLDMRLHTVEDFQRTPIAHKNDKPIYLNDIADVELAVDKKQYRTRVNGKTGVMVVAEKSVDANPIEVATLLRKEAERLQKLAPSHMTISVDIDQSIFIKASLKNIYSSIVEAVILVLLIVFLFLGNFRATLIPLVTIPISLIGGIAIMQMFGMSINTLTLLAMVLSIGLVVDDAIVVLENISRHIEEGMNPFDASIKGIREMSFAIVAMTCTLASVYLPIAFIQGIIGKLFIEFAVTLAGSVIISGIVALTLSPMMCGAILKSNTHNDIESKMQRFLVKLEAAYAKLLKKALSSSKLIISITLLSLVISTVVLKFSVHEIVPKEDRGIIGVYIQPQPGKSLDDFEQYAYKIEHIVSKVQEKENYLTFLGPWGVSTCLILKPHGERGRHQNKIKEEIEPEAQAIPSVDAWPWSWEMALPGIDAFGGTDLTFAISTTGSYEDLSKYADLIVADMNASGKFLHIRHNVKFDSAIYNIILDKHKLANLELSPKALSKSVGTFFSGNQDIRFSKDSILYPITIISKTNPWSLNELYLTDKKKRGVSVGSLAEMKESTTLAMLPHHNQKRAANITATQIPKYSIEELMPIVKNIGKKILPDGYAIEWTGAAEMAEKASGTMLLLFAMAVVFIYAILALQFDSFSDPLIVMITVPLACAGGLVTSWACGGTINIYSEIGLITLVGLITKHGILIVDFANRLIANGDISIIESVSKAALQRLRPILMTTSAMILGTLPLVFSSGAGSEARSAIGIVLVGGLVFGTIFTLFVLPKVYCWVKTSASK